MSKSLIVVDDLLCVIVDSEKHLLTREVIKHYKDRFADEVREKNKTLADTIASMLKKLVIEHEIISAIEKVEVIGCKVGESIKESAKSEAESEALNKELEEAKEKYDEVNPVINLKNS